MKQLEKKSALEQEKVESNLKLVEESMPSSHDDIKNISKIPNLHYNPIAIQSENSGLSPSINPVLSINNNTVAIEDNTPTINSCNSSITQTASSNSKLAVATKADTLTVEKVQEAIEKALKKQTNDIKKFWQTED